MKIIQKIILFLIIFVSFNANADSDVAKGRKVIKQLQKEIREILVLSEYELKLKTPEFRESYSKIILPNLKNISAHISQRAIKWIEVDNKQEPELIFWTEGLYDGVEGAKEFLFAIDVNDKEKPKLILINQLNPEPSKVAKAYEFSRFYPYPNQGRGYNNFLRGVFSYATFDADITNFVNYEIFWNKYYNKIDLREFYSSFPIAVEKIASEKNKIISEDKK